MDKDKLTANMMIEQINMLEAQGRGSETAELRQRVHALLDRPVAQHRSAEELADMVEASTKMTDEDAKRFLAEIDSIIEEIEE